MPEAMERALRARAARMKLSGKRANAYVYGTMRKTGWKPGMKENSPSYQPIKKRFLKSNRYQDSVSASRGGSQVSEDYRYSKEGRARQRPSLPTAPPGNNLADRKRAMYKEALMRRAKKRYRGPESPRGTQS